MNAENNARLLWCIVSGESTAFRVTAPASSNTSQLKTLIHGEKPNAFRDVAHWGRRHLPKCQQVGNLLTLWKVGSFYRHVQMF
jgi:Crinkler effector protein N-terminal domain